MGTITGFNRDDAEIGNHRSPQPSHHGTITNEIANSGTTIVYKRDSQNSIDSPELSHNGTVTNEIANGETAIVYRNSNTLDITITNEIANSQNSMDTISAITKSDKI